jgi:sterol desaturase/sphingolipid hydroxylase (fatty acid hydroxylase superfamily)
MSQMSLVQWVLLSLVFFFVVSATIALNCRILYARLQIAADRRYPARLSTWKVAALFTINASQIGAGIWLAMQFFERGWGGLYVERVASPMQAAMVAGQVLLILFLLDTHFYWVHRLAHRYKRVFALVHAEHHRPRFPNVWHLKFQNPLDYLATTVLPIPLIALLPVPLSIEAYMVAMAMAAIVNVSGHSGHEVTRTLPGLLTFHGWAAYIDPHRRWVARLFNNVLHHDLHHQKLRQNFSLYFTVWDRLGGSFAPETDDVEAYLAVDRGDPQRGG